MARLPSPDGMEGLVLQAETGYLAVVMRPSANKQKKLDYPEQIEGGRLAAKVGKLASKLSSEEETGHFRIGRTKINGAQHKEIIEEAGVFEEYGLKAEEVDKAAARDLAAIRRDRKAGKLKAWKP